MQHVEEFEPLPFGPVERRRASELSRAGVRERSGHGTPTSTFVAVETAVLLMVAALAMTSIIVTADAVDPDAGPPAVRATEEGRAIAASGHDESARHAALLVAR